MVWFVLGIEVMRRLIFLTASLCFILKLPVLVSWVFYQRNHIVPRSPRVFVMGGEESGKKDCSGRTASDE